MEWVETRGRTLDEAKEHALDQLGVAEDDAEFEILEEPRPGLFGRVRGEARVRARVRPTQPRPKLDRRDRRKRTGRDEDTGADGSPEVATAEPVATPAVTVGEEELAVAGGAAAEASTARPRARRGGRGGRGRNGVAMRTDEAGGGDGTDAAGEAAGEVARGGDDDVSVGDGGDAPTQTGRGGGARRARTPRATPPQDDVAAPGRHVRNEEDDVDAQQVGDEAQRFVQGLVDAFGLEGTTSLRRDGDDLEVSVDGADLGLLVGPRGTTLQAVQELTRVAAQRRLGDHDTRLRVDVAGYRERRREALTRFAHQVASEVVAQGTARRLEPMSSADRKVIHDVLSDVDGVATRSEGDDPQRCVVIEPATS